MSQRLFPGMYLFRVAWLGLVLTSFICAQEPPRRVAQPDAVEKHFRAAQTFQVSGDFDKAATEYRQAIAGALDRISNIRIADGKYSEALELLERAQVSWPKYVDARIDFAMACFYMGNFDKARLAAEAVLKDEENFRALNILAKIHLLEGDFAGAAEQLEIALKLQADFDVAYTLALTDLKLKKQTAAAVLFDEMLVSLTASPKLRSLIGTANRQAGYATEAVSQFQKAIALDPMYPSAHSGLGLAYLLLDSKEYVVAENEFRSELKINPKDYISHYFLGLVALADHKSTEALEWLEQAARLQPEQPDVLFHLARAYLAVGRRQDASTALRKSIAVVTPDPVRQEEKIRARNLLNRITEREVITAEGPVARAATSQGVSSVPQEEEISAGANLKDEVLKFDEIALRSMLTRNPPKPNTDSKFESQYLQALSAILGDSYNNLGVIDARAGRYTDAAAEFSQAARWNPDIQMIDRNWGIAAFRADLHQQAITPLEKQLKRTPQDMTIREMLGMSYFMTEDFNKSAEVFRPIVDSLPKDPGILYAAGMSLVRSGDTKGGMKLISRLLAENPDLPEVHLMLGQAHAQQGEPTDALAEFVRALQLNPNLHEAHHYSGMIYFQQGKMDEAAREFQAELAINPGFVPAEYQLAYVLLTQQDVEEAVRLLTAVIEQKPAYSDAYYQLGKAMLEKGEVKAAIEKLETATRLQPSAPYSYYQLSLAYRRAGRSAEAQQALQKYQALHDSLNKPEAKN